MDLFRQASTVSLLETQRFPDDRLDDLYVRPVKKLPAIQVLKDLFQIKTVVNEAEESEVDQSKIDFKKLLQQHQERNEKTLPFTLHQVEDVIFIDNRLLLSLEYIFYQKDGNYHQINTFEDDRVSTQEDLYDELNAKSYNPQKYNEQVQAFMNKPVEQEVKNRDYLLQNEHSMIDSDYDNIEKVEAILGLWRITPTGQIEKDKQKQFKYEIPFHPTKYGKMRLKLSQNKKIVSLVTQLSDHKEVNNDELRESDSESSESGCEPSLSEIEDSLVTEEYGSEKAAVIKKPTKQCNLCLYAWEVDSLEPIPILSALQSILKTQLHGIVKNCIFVGKNSDHLLQILKLHKHEKFDGESRKIEWLEYTIFDVASGNIIFKFENNLRKNDLRVLGFLVYMQHEENEGQPPSDRLRFSQDQKQKTQANPNDLDLVFFYAYPEKNKKKLKTKGKLEWFKVINKFIKMQDLIKLGDMERQKSYLLSEGVKKIKAVDKGTFIKPTNVPELDIFMEIPKEWFIRTKAKGNESEENWEGNLSIQTVVSFERFAFINNSRRFYLAFTPDIEDGERVFKETLITFAKKSYASHGRNQCTKDHLYFINKIQNEGSSVHLIYDHRTQKSVFFDSDYYYCSPDVTYNINNEINSVLPEIDKIMLQACTITQTDQNIQLQTIYKQDSYDDIHNFKISRKTQLQDISSKFPIFGYNIGIKKLVFQNTLGEGQQYIFNLPETENFVSFVEYSNLRSLGFFSDQLRIETCSQFVFLTLNTLNQQKIINVILIDPYYFPCKILIFKSSKTFPNCLDNLKCHDLVVKNIVFCTAKNAKDVNYEVKLLTQYNSHYHISTLQHCQYDEIKFEYSKLNYTKGIKTIEEQIEAGQIEHPIAPIKMIMDLRGHIYYILYVDGICLIKEIIPRQSDWKDHLTIIEIKSDQCLGFSISDDSQKFYFMDDYKQICVSKRIPDTKSLIESKELKIKEKDRTHFKVKENFSNMILSDTYLIFESQIFYLYQDTPYANGILDMEKLSQAYNPQDGKVSTEKFQLGPFQVDGNNQFVVIFKDSNTFRVKAKFFQQPDSFDTSLLADYNKKCCLSTFLKNGDILVQVLDRFLVFNSQGDFINPVKFQTSGNEDKDDVLRLQNIVNRQRDFANNKISMQENIQMGIKDLFTAQGANKNFADKKMQLRKKMKTQAVQSVPEEFMEGGEDEEFKVFEESEDEYYFEDYQQNVTFHNRMRLLRISRGNSYFLFEDRIMQNFKVFKLEMISFVFFKKKQRIFQFLFQYEVDLLSLKIIKDFFPSNVATYDRVSKHIFMCGQFKVSDQGDIDITMNTYKRDQIGNDFYVYACILKRKKKSVVKKGEVNYSEYSFMRRIEFESNGTVGIQDIIEQQIKEMKNLLEIELMYQNNLPETLKDSQKAENLAQGIRNHKIKQQHMVSQSLVGNEILVVNSGPFIKYTRIPMNDLNPEDANGNIQELEFEDLGVQFSKETMILLIWGTENRNHIQIIAKDISCNLLMIMTWDIEMKMENSMFQIKCDPGTCPENYIVRGMNLNNNYYVSECQIFDLHTNLPLQSIKGNSLRNDKLFQSEKNQNKVFRDGSRMLNIDQQNILTFPTNHMNILLWKNIHDLGDTADIIEMSTKLSHFAVIYNEQSLFHYFITATEIVEAVHDKYMVALENGTLTEEEKYMPLSILHEDNTGNTAIEMAVEMQRPKMFELMVDFMSVFNDFCFTKMMMTVFPKMLKTNTNVIQKFFENCFFVPQTLKEPMTVQWLQKSDRMIFTSNTSMITKDIMNNEIAAHAFQFLKQDQLDAIGEEEKTVANESVSMSKSQIVIDGKNTTNTDERNYKLEFQEGKPDAQINATRVRIRAVNFDWIFQDDNCMNLLLMLTNDADSGLFKSSSIKTFIELLWQYYQPKIVRKVFLPYCWYLVCQMLMSSGFAGSYFRILELPEDKQEEMMQTKIILATIVLVNSLMALNLWWFFFKIEFSQFKQQPKEYFNDYNNWIDLTSQITSISFFIILDSTIFLNKIIISIQNLRVWGGFACFLLWIKMFQWMRLFKPTARFISLISQVFMDVKIFNLMMIIVMAAFGNFYYTMNNNSKMTNESHYVGNYTRIKLVDAMIQMYIFSLGEVDIIPQRSGPDHIVSFILFILSTFVLFVIFMNLLIAIISDTFEDVESKAEESGLQEQANLIADFIWLLDPKDLFKGKKYMILVEPDVQEKNEVNFKKALQKLQLSMCKKEDQMLQTVTKRIEDFEKASRIMQKATYTITLRNKEQMNELDKKIVKMLKIKHLKDHLTFKTPLSAYEIPKQVKKFIFPASNRMLNTQTPTVNTKKDQFEEEKKQQPNFMNYETKKKNMNIEEDFERDEFDSLKSESFSEDEEDDDISETMDFRAYRHKLMEDYKDKKDNGTDLKYGSAVSLGTPSQKTPSRMKIPNQISAYKSVQRHRKDKK